MNTVRSLQNRPFSQLTLEEKLEVKRLGPERPQLLTTSGLSSRRFTKTWYSKHSWITGCSHSGKVYCFPCLLFGDSQREKAWTQSGVNDWKHLSEKVKRHVKCSCHVENCLKLAFFGKTNIAEQLSKAYRDSLIQHNLEVERNRHILSRIIDCIKFCGAFELALRGHDENLTSDNPGVFLGLVNFAAALDSVLSQHLESATVFKGTSKTIQNELLDIMLKTLQCTIQKEVKQADFVAVIADDTSDVSNHLQNVVVFRYIVSGKVVERFWSFCDLPQGNAENISANVISCLNSILPGAHDKQKLVAQCYDGASVMSGQHRGVQSIVKETYPNAHYVHCYAHQLNLILQQATSQIVSVRVFFAHLNAFSIFFSHSTKRVSCLDDCVAIRIPRSVQTRWNFESRIVSTVFEHKDDLKVCFKLIINTWKKDKASVHDASGLLLRLEDRSFMLYLRFFHQLMPHVDVLYAQLQKRQISSTFIQTCLRNFVVSINNVREKISDIFHNDSCAVNEEPLAKRPRCECFDEEISMVLEEVCDIVISHCSSRFAITGHFVAATLFESSSFPYFEQCFPSMALESAAASFPFLDEMKLHSELSVIYSRPEFRHCCGAVPLLQLLIESNLAETFSETVLLLKAIITVPMTSCEAERCFSTLKRVKTFLRNTISEDRLNALAMLSIEKNLVRDSIDFNQNVIDMFAQLKNRRAKFLFK